MARKRELATRASWHAGYEVRAIIVQRDDVRADSVLFEVIRDPGRRSKLGAGRIRRIDLDQRACKLDDIDHRF
jgi:hypothetical protein